MPEEEEKSGQPGDLTPGVFVYLCVGVFCICIFVYLVFGLCGPEEEKKSGQVT